MLSIIFKRLLFLLGSVLLCIATQMLLFSWGDFFGSRSAPSQSRSTHISLPTPSQATVQNRGFPFEAGVVFPQWSPTSYGPSDTAWLQGVSDIQVQTGAEWIEMPILLSQNSPTSTQVFRGQSTPSVESVVAGIRAARAHGYHVFVVPLLGVIGPGLWAANIQFFRYDQEVEWFNSFWQAFQPYVIAAQIAGAEQVSIGTEEIWLEQFAPDVLWNTLITHVRSVFSGAITYNIDWSSLIEPIPTWMHNASLSTIGVTEYIPLTNVDERVDPGIMYSLWKKKIKPELDNFAIRLGRPIIISEIGYRDSVNALYHPWDTEARTSPPDPAEQAAACDAALANLILDPHVAGVFFWGWDGVGAFKLSGKPALPVIHKWFTSLQTKERERWSD